MSSKPLWLKAVHKVERAVGGPIEAAVRTDTYFDIVTKATRVTGTVKRKVSGTSTRVLHGINLPAGSDMQGMREQLARMERRINRLTEEVADPDGPRRDRIDGTPPDRAPVDLRHGTNAQPRRPGLPRHPGCGAVGVAGPQRGALRPRE